MLIPASNPSKQEKIVKESKKRLISAIRHQNEEETILLSDIDAEMRRLQKRSEGPSCFGVMVFLLFAGLGVTGCVEDGIGSPLGWIFSGIALLLLVISVFRTGNADDQITAKLSSESVHFSELHQSLQKEKDENKNWEKIVAAINECERYEEEMATKN